MAAIEKKRELVYWLISLFNCARARIELATYPLGGQRSRSSIPPSTIEVQLSKQYRLDECLLSDGL